MKHTAVNPITGDKIVTKPSKAFEENWSAIFGESKFERKLRLEREAKAQTPTSKEEK